MQLLLELYNVVLVRVMDSLFIVGVLNVIRRTSNVAHLPQRKQSVSQLNGRSLDLNLFLQGSSPVFGFARLVNCLRQSECTRAFPIGVMLISPFRYLVSSTLSYLSCSE